MVLTGASTADEIASGTNAAMDAATAATAATAMLTAEMNALRARMDQLLQDFGEAQRSTQLDLNNLKQSAQGAGGLKVKAAERHMPSPWGNEKGQIPFAEMQFRLENWLAALDPTCNPGGMLNWAATFADQIEPQHVAGQGHNAQLIDRELYLTLATITTGSPAKLVRKAGAGNGFRAWQAIATNCRPRSVIDGATAMAQIQMQARTKTLAEFRAKLDAWDLQVTDYEARYTEKISDNSKVASVLMMMPIDLYQRKFEGETGRTYLDIRRMVADIMAASPEIGRGVAPMDLGNIGDSTTPEQGHNQVPDQRKDDINKLTEMFEQLNAFMKGDKGGKGGVRGGTPSWQGKGALTGSTYGPWSSKAGSGKAKGDKGAGKGGRDGGKGKSGKPLVCHQCGGIGHPKRLCPSINCLEGHETSEEPQQEGCGEEEVPWMLNLHEDDTQRGKVSSTTGEWHRWSKTGHVRSMRLTGNEPNSTRSQLSCGFHLLEDDYEEELNQCDELHGARGATGWHKITAVVDSGAVDNVIREDELPFIPLEPSERSKEGRGFRGPGGEPIPTSGQRTAVVKTAEGQARRTKWNVCPVKRNLASVAKMHAAGNSVHLTAKDPHILNEKTKERTALRKEGNVFVVDLWVRVPSPPVTSREAAPRATKADTAARAKQVTWSDNVEMAHICSGFTRQGR